MYNVIFIILGSIAIAFLIMLLVYVFILMRKSLQENKIAVDKEVKINGTSYTLVESSKIKDKETLRVVNGNKVKYPANFKDLKIDNQIKYLDLNTFKNLEILRKHLFSLNGVSESKDDKNFRYEFKKRTLATIKFIKHDLVCEINIVGSKSKVASLSNRSVRGAFKLSDPTSLNGAVNTINLVYKSILEK